MNIQTKPSGVSGAIDIGRLQNPPVVAQKSKIELLLEYEAAMRDAADQRELSYILVNDWRQIVSAKQIHCLELNGVGTYRVSYTSDVTNVDARAQLCIKISEQVQLALQSKPSHDWQSFLLSGLTSDDQPYPYPYALAANISHKTQPTTRQIVALSSVPFTDSDRVIFTRLGATAAHAYWAMSNKGKRVVGLTNKAKLGAIAALSVCLIGFMPVPLSILAPAEIVASNPFIAAAPLSGVIESIEVEPNSPITAGTILLKLNDVELRSILDIAEKSVAIAEARLRRAQQGAGASTELRREVGIAQSELALSIAERNGALARLERTIVRSPYDGVVMFNRKEDWIGRSVSTGERILEIANPQNIEVAIEVGLADSIVLDSTQAITLFLDSNPLKPVAATFKSAGYQAQYTRDRQLAFPARATINETNNALRIGQRGTAQLRAQKVSLAYFLFRRPLAALRQKVGL